MNKIKNRYQLQKMHPHLYRAMLTKFRHILDECMPSTQIKITHDTCKLSALKYATRNEWSTGDGSCYRYARHHGILDEMTKHMESNKITHEICKLSALKYATRNEWNTGDSGCYQYALRHGIIDEMTKHMKVTLTRITHETCKLSALEYATRKEWQTGDGSCYKYARRHGIIDEITKHMESQFQRSYAKLISEMPPGVKFADGQEWKGVNHKYKFVCSVYGEFTTTAASATRSWKRGCSGHPGNLNAAKRKSVMCVETGEVFKSVTEAAKKVKVDHSNVSAGLTGRRKTSGGFRWTYYDEKIHGPITTKKGGTTWTKI